MRLNFTLFTLLLLSSATNAQQLTGIWRGYFSSAGGIYSGSTREENYKYEIQIEQQTNNGIKGVTYSYKSTVFYGKADVTGIFTGSTKSLLIKETKLVEVKIGDKSEPCLMTCYLDYSKIGKLEVLQGTFISINVKDKSDCGSGKVYLEKVPVSDFKTEDFLLKKKPEDTNKLSGKVSVSPKPVLPKNTPSKPPVLQPGAKQNKKEILTPKPVPSKSSVTQQKPTNVPQKITKPVPQKPAGTAQSKPVKILPKITQPPAKKLDQKKAAEKKKAPAQKENKPDAITKPVERIQEEPINSKKQEETSPQESLPQRVPVPKVLTERENKLEKIITTSEEYIQVDLYDNGTIDNDTISVYHNNQLVVSNSRLTYAPITIKIKCNKKDSRHELVVVAENLGDIPPNTALMVVKAGKERYEVFLTSNEQRNAKLIINYVPKE
jgi:hypothetical protein